jgi:hypothetical protein
MNTALRHFIHQYLLVVLLALMPVMLTAFLSIPLSLGGHPGEPRNGQPPPSAHMT